MNSDVRAKDTCRRGSLVMSNDCDYDVIVELEAAQKVTQKRLECMKRNVCANDTCKRGTSIMSTGFRV